METIAKKLFNTHNDINLLITDCESLALEVVQNWETETTVFIFLDDSKIEICNSDWRVTQ